MAAAAARKTEGAPAPAAKKPAVIKITLDRTRPHGTVIGDRLEDDPNHRVSFEQDGLPFDNQGALVPDNGLREARPGINSDGKPVTHQPLYNEARAKLLAARQERQRRLGARAAAEVEEDEDVTEQSDRATIEAAAKEINLEAWAKGDLEYEPFLIIAAHRQRYGINRARTAEVLADLIDKEDIRMVTEDQLPERRLKMLSSVTRGT